MLRHHLANHLKNILSWKTNKKYIIFSVDDYGNVRTDSKEALVAMSKRGAVPLNRFDNLDSLETSDDLSSLYDVLGSVKGGDGKHPVFTPFSLPCNIDFEKMARYNYEEYFYETVDFTFTKQAERYPKAYQDAWRIWKEGIEAGFMKPQFHGREHFNLKVFKEKLKLKDSELIAALQNRSNSCISSTGYTTINYTSAFSFWEFQENDYLSEIIKDGLNCFEKVFGYRATHFNPPGGREHSILHSDLIDLGVVSIDNSFIKKEHQGNGKYKTSININGGINSNSLVQLSRNVVFEPNESDNINWVSYAMNQIDLAFKYRAPANISTHRVNFSGFINESNREMGLQKLKDLLKRIVSKYPDVEFISVDQLIAKITSSHEYKN
jgi:hypothetical protein